MVDSTIQGRQARAICRIVAMTLPNRVTLKSVAMRLSIGESTAQRTLRRVYGLCFRDVVHAVRVRRLRRALFIRAEQKGFALAVEARWRSRTSLYRALRLDIRQSLRELRGAHAGSFRRRA